MGEFCRLCECKDHNDQPGSTNYYCPLLGDVICDVCCVWEFDGGMGSRSAAEDMCELSSKTPQQAFKACESCKHGAHIKKAYSSIPKEPEDAKRLKWLKGERK